MPKAKKNPARTNAAATIGYEAEPWRVADTLRERWTRQSTSTLLGLVFLKYISDAFDEHHAQLEAERAPGADPEDPDE